MSTNKHIQSLDHKTILALAVVQIWSILLGLPLCFVAGMLYSWASGKTFVDGFINAYGALYKIPGNASPASTLLMLL